MAIVLVTRAQPEAAATAARLRARGHHPLVSSALEIQFEAFAPPLAGAQAILFTSAAAAHAAGAHAQLRALPVLAVGDATAEAARELGFADVRSAGGAGVDLAALARATLDPQAGRVLHLRGADVAADIAADLRAAGFDTQDLIVYRAPQAAHLAAEALTALAARPPQLDAVLFHSARGSESFCRLMTAAGLSDAAASLSALCLSARVAQAAKALAWREIRVAPAPREDALLSLLGRPAGERA